MSIKRFCDGCDVELKRDCVSDRLRLQRGVIKVEIMVAVLSNGSFTWNSGNACEACVRKACAEGGFVAGGRQEAAPARLPEGIEAGGTMRPLTLTSPCESAGGGPGGLGTREPRTPLDQVESDGTPG